MTNVLKCHTAITRRFSTGYIDSDGKAIQRYHQYCREEVGWLLRHQSTEKKLLRFLAYSRPGLNSASARDKAEVLLSLITPAPETIEWETKTIRMSIKGRPAVGIILPPKSKWYSRNPFGHILASILLLATRRVARSEDKFFTGQGPLASVFKKLPDDFYEGCAFLRAALVKEAGHTAEQLKALPPRWNFFGLNQMLAEQET